MGKPQISPLRYAPVEMTKGRIVIARSRGLGMSKPQISPLRYATVEMTKGRAVVARSRCLGMGKPQVPPLRCAPVGMTRGVGSRFQGERLMNASIPGVGGGNPPVFVLKLIDKLY